MKPIHEFTVQHGPRVVALLAACVAGCRKSGNHSPVIDVLGSYFPAWMICFGIGLALTLITRLLLNAFKIDKEIYPAPLVYPCLMLVFTLAIWLAFFQN